MSWFKCVETDVFISLFQERKRPAKYYVNITENTPFKSDSIGLATEYEIAQDLDYWLIHV